MLMKEELEDRVKTDQNKRKLQTNERAIDFLYKHLNDIHQRKKEACETILERKQCGEEVCVCIIVFEVITYSKTSIVRIIRPTS